jgi:hypothetical protein
MKLEKKTVEMETTIMEKKHILSNLLVGGAILACGIGIGLSAPASMDTTADNMSKAIGLNYGYYTPISSSFDLPSTGSDTPAAYDAIRQEDGVYRPAVYLADDFNQTPGMPVTQLGQVVNFIGGKYMVMKMDDDGHALIMALFNIGSGPYTTATNHSYKDSDLNRTLQNWYAANLPGSSFEGYAYPVSFNGSDTSASVSDDENFNTTISAPNDSSTFAFAPSATDLGASEQAGSGNDGLADDSITVLDYFDGLAGSSTTVKEKNDPAYDPIGDSNPVWLRSPYYGTDHESLVLYLYTGFNRLVARKTVTENAQIRPAFWVNIEP